MTIPPNPHPEQVEAARMQAFVDAAPDQRERIRRTLEQVAFEHGIRPIDPPRLSSFTADVAVEATERLLASLAKPQPAQVEITQEDSDTAKAIDEALGPLMDVEHEIVLEALARQRLASLANRPADDGERPSASEQVAQWQREHLADPNSHWGDSIAWQSAFVIAKKLDEAAALPPQPEGVKRP